MLNGHLDTVGVQGMEQPFSARMERGRVYGRGAYDMKGGVAACIGAAAALAKAGSPFCGELLVAAVADEEHASLGTADLIERYQWDAAIVTEPTHLEICLAHKGFAWLEQELRSRPPHPLVGAPSLHAGVLRGGTAPSVYAASCKVLIERRTVPGETETAVLEEIRELIDQLQSEDPSFRAAARVELVRDPFETHPDSPVVAAVARAAERCLGRRASFCGQTPWMDSALLARAGIDTVVIGPAGAGAHAAEEWVDGDSVVQLSSIPSASSAGILRSRVIR
jgi:acetylornithine deacetylase